MNPSRASADSGGAVHLSPQHELHAVVFIQTLACLGQFSVRLREPLGLGEIGGGQEINTLEPGPARQVLEVQARTGGVSVG